MNLLFLYEDDWLAIIEKPTGLLTVPAQDNSRRTLTSIINEEKEVKEKNIHFYPCHRLDKDTSGLIIYAKGRSVQEEMMELFRQRAIKKTYIAFVQGRLKKQAGSIRQAIEGQQAITDFRVIGQRQGFTLVEVMPRTGRTNQIRIHFKGIGHPLVGEKKFAFRRDALIRANRLCLHASRLEFKHPVTGKHIAVDSRLPAGMVNFLEKHPV